MSASRQPEPQPPRGRRQRHVRLTTFDNEPLARLAEQRLRQEGIPCYTRSLRGGPGLWGSAHLLPHALYVYESDELRAREVLDLPPLELAERDRQDAPQRARWGLWLVLAIIIGTVLAVLISISPGL